MAHDHLRVSKVYLEWFSEFIHPGYSESGMKGFHLASLSTIFIIFLFFTVRIQNLSVVLTLQWGGNRNKIDTAIYKCMLQATNRD